MTEPAKPCAQDLEQLTANYVKPVLRLSSVLPSGSLEHASLLLVSAMRTKLGVARQVTYARAAL